MFAKSLRWKAFISFILVCVSGFSPAQESSFTGPKILKATKGLNSLPTDAGQFWMTYDISSYCDLYPNIAAPQNTLVNWILFDTGKEFWVREPFGVLSVTRQRLYVYHNQQVQQYISNVLDRFVDPARRNEMYSVRIMTVQTPEWKTRAADLTQPYPVKGKLVQGWLLPKENAVTFMNELSRRSDFAEMNTSRNTVPNGETYGWVLAAPVRNYIRDIRTASNVTNGYVTDSGTIDEGYRFEITPLLSTKGDMVEFMFRCESTLVEKTYPYNLKVPTANAPRQQLAAEVPQVIECERKDKISFPKDRVFLLDIGMIPLYQPKDADSGRFMENLSRMVAGKSLYQNVLVLIQSVEKPIAQSTTSLPVSGVK